ncbi:MAG TPA: protein kinase [Isosphaeraceae bacterium]|jgi:serine/threonine protein kinase|nr:protein kinase [Isosphaeraceae bacterium]
MADFDAETLAEQALLIGLISREQVREAMREADNGTFEALTRVLLRKQLLTSWQLDRLMKGETGGFFFGGAKVLFHIAEGTFARVYRGRKMPGNQSVAVKVLRKRFISDAAAVDRFNQEAEAGLKLVHPNIVRIYEYGEQDRQHYMTMEYVEGSNLRDFLKIRNRLTVHEALPMMTGLAQGLKHSIDQGITHRDIKGTNILIASNGTAKLVDFGLATIEGEEKKMAAAHGQRTVDYSALERTCGSAKGDPRSDIFFLGCVFYQMLTGQLPLPEVESKDPLAKMLKRSFGAIRPLAEQRHAPPPGLTAIIDKMMRIDLKARYQTMEEVVRELEAYQADQLAPAPVPAPSRPRPRPEAVAAARPAAAPAAGPADEAPDDDAFDEKPMAGKTILCVESQPPIQDAFRKALARLGFRVILIGDPDRAAERYRESPPDVVIYDTDGLGSDPLHALLDMHEKAHEDGNELAALVLLGPRQGILADRLPEDDRLIVLTKPVKMKDVQDALSMLVPVA